MPNTVPESVAGTGSNKPVHVAVGLIQDAQGQVLIALRPAQLHQGGLWEFPGGKVEVDESVLDALQRELQEELGIEIDPAQCVPLKKIRHDYPDKSVLLDVWRVDAFSGTPQGREGQVIAWQAISKLDAGQFPRANHAIVQLLKLPDRIAITGAFANLAQLTAGLVQLQEQGIRLVQLRQPGMSQDQYCRAADHAAQSCQRLGMQLQCNAPLAWRTHLTAAGLHLSAREMTGLSQRPCDRHSLFSVSCHNLAELEQAQRLDADFAFLSPVLATESHVAANPLGWEAFARLKWQVSVPLYALGGMQAADLPLARSCGAQGIAAISAFWNIQV